VAERDLPPVPIKTPVIDDSGMISTAWSAWFRQLFFRVGGNAAKTNIELDILRPGAITTAMLADDAVTAAKINPDVAGEGLVPNATTGALDVNVDNVTLEVASDIVQVKDSGITTAKIGSQAVTLDKISQTGATAGQVIRYDGSSIVWDTAGSSGTPGTVLTDGRGGSSIDISPTPSDLIIEDSGATKWRIKIGNDGVLYSETPTGLTTTTPFKIQKPDTSYAQICVNTDGTLFVDSVPTATDANNYFFLASPDGTLWQLAIDDANEIYTIGFAGDETFSITNSAGDIYWQVRALPGFAVLQYLRVLNATQLATATPPPSVSGCLPITLYNSGSAIRLIFHDGSAWKYVHDNSSV